MHDLSNSAARKYRAKKAELLASESTPTLSGPRPVLDPRPIPTLITNRPDTTPTINEATPTMMTTHEYQSDASEDEDDGTIPSCQWNEIFKDLVEPTGSPEKHKDHGKKMSWNIEAPVFQPRGFF